MPAVLGGLLRIGVALSQSEVAVAAIIAVLPPVNIRARPDVGALIEVVPLAALTLGPARLRITIARFRTAIVRPDTVHVGRCGRALVAPGPMITAIAVAGRPLVLRGRGVAAGRPVVRGQSRAANRAVRGPPVRVALLPRLTTVGQVRGRRFKLPALPWVPLPVGISAPVRVRTPLGLATLARRRQRRKLPAIGRRRRRRKLPALIWIPLALGIAAPVRVRTPVRLPALARRRQWLKLTAILRVLVLPDLPAPV